MTEGKLRTGIHLAGVSAAALAISYAVLKSLELGIALYVLGLVGILLFLQPFIGLCIYVIFIYLSPQQFVPGLANIRLMLITGGATFGSMLIRRAMTERALPLIRAPQDLFMMWFLTAIIVSHLAHGDPGAAVSSAVDFLDVFVLYLLITNLLTNERRVTVLLWVILLSTVALSIQGIVQGITGEGIFAGQLVKKGRVEGIGHFENPNMLAIAIVSILPFAYYAIVRGVALVRPAMVAATGVLLTSLYFTNSRSGVITFGLVTALLVGKRIGVVRGAIFAGLLATAVFVLGPSRMATVSASEASAHERLLAWDAGLDMFTNFPLFGIGADAWAAKYKRLVAHNSFIHCGAELGLFGLIPWVLLFTVSLRSLWFVAARARESGQQLIMTEAEVLLFGVVAFAVSSLFISKTYHVLFFMLAAMAAAVTRVFVNSTEREYVLFERRDLVYALFATLAGLVSFKLFLLALRVT